MYARLSADFYLRENVVRVAKDLLGKVICTYLDGHLTTALIVETEAYQGVEDKASHAYNNRRTKRTEVMFSRGGFAYVYLCYGIHHLFNVVTAPQGIPHAVLIRAVQPLEGLSKMMERRKMNKITPRLTAGPGIFTKAMGITNKWTGVDMLSAKTPVWLEERHFFVEEEQIESGPRIGIDYAEEWIDQPMRFWIRNSIWMSHPR